MLQLPRKFNKLLNCLMNVLHKSLCLFKVAMTEGDFSDSHAEFLAELFVENQ